MDEENEEPKSKKTLILWWVILLVLIIGASLAFIYLRKDSVKQACSDPKIKGNISVQDGEKIYHKPGDRYYSATQIDTSKGEKYFCTEKEAQDAGWRHSKV